MFKVFLLVLYNNTLDDIKNYLECFENMDNFRLLILNNGLPNKQIENYLKLISFCSYTQAKSNTGFGGGHNLILDIHREQLPPETLLFISNLDIKFRQVDIKTIESYFLNNDIVALNPRIVNTDYTPQKIHYYIPSAWSQFRFKFLSNTNFKIQYQKRNFLLESGKNPINVEILSGCFLITRFKDFQSAGGFNPNYFLYFEDWDLSRRLAKIGKLILLNNVEIIHKHKSEANFKFKPFLYYVRSFLRFHRTWN